MIPRSPSATAETRATWGGLRPWLLPLALAASLSVPTAAEEPPASASEDRWSGVWEVGGQTVDPRTGDTRRLEGRIVLTRTGEHWSVTAELRTDFPSEGGSVRADLLGRGEGREVGEELVGETHTQIVFQTVPGVDTEFAYLPREVGPRIVSDWKAQISPTGMLRAELASRGEPGEVYSPTRTTLRGRRIAEADPRR